jgi:hypothetical protein
MDFLWGFYLDTLQDATLNWVIHIAGKYGQGIGGGLPTHGVPDHQANPDATQ